MRAAVELHKILSRPSMQRYHKMLSKVEVQAKITEVINYKKHLPYVIEKMH